jgi:Icc-related predicted phosphoesterase
MKKSIHVIAMSDLHGLLPPSKDIPKCDLILIGGDICGSHVILDQSIWLHREFKPWLENLPAEKVIGVAGNHDFIWEKAPHLVPKMPWTYLQDSVTEYKGWKIYGTPWQPRFFDWAFNLDEPDLERKWNFIPDDTDILVAHGPPYGHGDRTLRLYGKETNHHVGSPSLLERVKKVKPRLMIYGHIHPGYGVFDLDGSVLANVSLVDEKYRWVNQPTEFFLEEKTTRAILKKVDSQVQSSTIIWEREHAAASS